MSFGITGLLIIIIIVIGVAVIFQKIGQSRRQAELDDSISEKDWLPTFLICVFLGGLGIHRFFVGKIVTGLLMLITLGGIGVWYLIDVIVVAMGSFTDKSGALIKYQRDRVVVRELDVSAQSPTTPDIPSQLEKLAELKTNGIITEEEYEQKRKDLLDRM